MANDARTWQRNILLTAALAVLMLGLFAALEAPRYTYTGYSRTGSRVVKVDDGSPAAVAGLRPGDRLDSVNGIPLRSIGDLEHRLIAGDTWQLVVRRNDAILPLRLSPTGQPAIELVRARSRSMFGLCLVAFTLWAFIAAPGPATMLLAVGGLSFGLLALGAPYSAPGSVVGRALEVTATLALACGMVVVVHFLLAFPSRGRLLQRPWALRVLYTPALVVGIAAAGNGVLPPALWLNSRLVGIVFTSLSLAYLLLAIVLLMQRFFVASRAERSKHGLGLMLGSSLAVLVPFFFLAVASNLWPAMGRAYDVYSPYAAGTFSIVPLAFSVAAVRSARGGRTSVDTKL